MARRGLAAAFLALSFGSACGFDIDEALCLDADLSEDGQCGLSLRQLRGERQVAQVKTPDAADSEQEEVPVPEEADASPCRHMNWHCEDHMTYGTRDLCNKEPGCLTLDSGDFGGTPGEKWYCASANETCRHQQNIKLDIFVSHTDSQTESADDLDESVEDVLDVGMEAQAASGYRHGRRRWSAPVGGRLMTLYHTTSYTAAQSIVRSGFRPGRGGWCGGAMYFINTPYLPKTKFGPVTHNGAILEAKVRMGRTATAWTRHCKGYGGTGVYAARRSGFQSLVFNPGDGQEFIIWDPKQVESVKIYQLTR